MLTANELRQLLEYDPATGVFIWKERPNGSVSWNKRFAGKVAGRTIPNGRGYLEIVIGGKLYFSHRLAWFYVTDAWPIENIDHADGDKTNNRFGNLREASASQNGWNANGHRDSALGLKGVYRQTRCETYTANFRVNKRRVYVGAFNSPEDAAAAVSQARKQHHGQFAKN